jgi:hypothetical protein
MTLEEIRRLSTAFRTAMERSARLRQDINFEHFPRGACDETALLLARYLLAHGALHAHYVSASRGEGDSWTSRAWLLVDAITVDITADQFADTDQAVIALETSPWHAATFEIEGDPQPGDYRAYDAHTVWRLNGLYSLILAELEPELRPPAETPALARGGSGASVSGDRIRTASSSSTLETVASVR